jgi:hypothetical protein
VRSGGVIQNKTKNLFFNPFLKLERHSKTVVYSSGSFGQHILSTNLKTKFFEIIKWIDVDFHDLNIGGTSVKPISSITNDEFDFLIIATINPSTFNSIKMELGLMGIDEHKIIQIDTNLKRIDRLLIDLGFNENFLFQHN